MLVCGMNVEHVLEELRNGQFAFEMYAGPQEWRRLRAIDISMPIASPSVTIAVPP